MPGFKHDQHSTAHIFILGNPLIKNDELKLLSRYGLKYVYPDVPFICVFEDGATIGLHRDRNKTAQDIAQFSAKDADAFQKFAATAETFLPLVAATFYAPPLPMGASLAMLDQSEIGRQLFALMHKSAYDVVIENFENERVRLFLCRLISENLTGPEEKGTALGLYVFLAFMETYGVGVPIGGSGALSQALIRCIEDHGGTVLAHRPVERVLTRNGRAVGVRSSDGTEYAAKDAVIGAIHPHVLGTMVPDVDPAIADAARRTEISANVCFTVHAALNQPLRFKAGGHVNNAYFTELMPNRLDDLRGFFDSLRYGKIPNRSLIGLISASTFDPSRCPPGKATLHIWDYVPYAHPDAALRPGTGSKSPLDKLFYRGFVPSWTISGRTTSSPPITTARSTWSERRRVSGAAIFTALPTTCISRALIGRRRTSGEIRFPASSVFIWLDRSSIPVAECSGRDAQPPCRSAKTSRSISIRSAKHDEVCRT